MQSHDSVLRRAPPGIASQARRLKNCAKLNAGSSRIQLFSPRDDLQSLPMIEGGIDSLDTHRRRVPMWMKIISVSLLCILLPIYSVKWGFANFLWFSDISLIATTIAICTENALLASMMAAGVLIPETVWNVDFFGRLLIGFKTSGLSDYMFNTYYPLWLRLLSLFHVPLPIALIWLLYRLGYDRRAPIAQTILCWIVLPLSWLLGTDGANINWVYQLGPNPQKITSPLRYLGLMMLVFPVVFYFPTHLVLSLIFRRPLQKREEMIYHPDGVPS